jgi:hypothetical protein
VRRWIVSKVCRSGMATIIGGGDGSLMGGGAVALSDLSDEQLAALKTLSAVRLPAEPEAIEGSDPAFPCRQSIIGALSMHSIDRSVAVGLTLPEPSG